MELEPRVKICAECCRDFFVFFDPVLFCYNLSSGWQWISLKLGLCLTLMFNKNGTSNENEYCSWGIANNCHQISKEHFHLPVHIVLTLFQNNILLCSLWMGKLLFLISFLFDSFQRYYHWMNENPQVFCLLLVFLSHYSNVFMLTLSLLLLILSSQQHFRLKSRKKVSSLKYLGRLRHRIDHSPYSNLLRLIYSKGMFRAL